MWSSAPLTRELARRRAASYRRGVDVLVDRHSGAPPEPSAIEKRLRSEARDVYGWSNGPADRYEQHAHAYHKLLYCTHGVDRFHPRRWTDADADGGRPDVATRRDATRRARRARRVRLRRGQGLNSPTCVRSRAGWGGSAPRQHSRSSRVRARSRPRAGASSISRSASLTSTRHGPSSPRASRRSNAVRRTTRHRRGFPSCARPARIT